MKLSLVIPAYNEEAYIGACLESVMRQTEKSDEIIVVDNNSTDRTAEILSRYPVRILKEEQQGMIPARNAGFNAAQYDIIARCDADDVLPGDWVARIKRNFTELKIDALCGPLIYSDLPVKTAIVPNLYLDTMKALQFGNETMVGPNMALTRSMWEKVRDKVCLDDKRVHEDIDLGMKIIQAGGTIYRDRQLIVRSSARRMKKRPLSFFVEYPWRFVKTFVNHVLHR
ncbi:MAG: glycosyltransferase family 2 protein [Candidatus Peribacteraceae bacterium]|nr:glycosyltransferase family 2 protein [Candidatus Peribacteraceae bacterium]